MNGAKKDEIEAFDAMHAPSTDDASSSEKPKTLPMTPFEGGVRVNCTSFFNQSTITVLANELQNTKGNIVLDFKGTGSVGLPLLSSLAQFAKGVSARRGQVYLLRPSDDTAKLVTTQGLSNLLKIALKPSMVPGLKDEAVPKLDLKFVNSFIDSTIDTLKTQCSVESKSLKPFLSNSKPAVHGDIIGLITIKSETFNGVIAISMPEKIFLYAMGKMVSETFTEITEEVASGATELLNIIYGNAKMMLNEQGYKLQKAIPSVIRGKNISLTHVTSSPTLIIPFETETGVFHIEIGVSEIQPD